MINDQLLGYIRLQSSQNVPKETIISSLKSQGWTDADINEAFGAIASPSVTPLPSSTKNKNGLWIVLFLILLGGGSAAGYFLYLKPQSEALVVAPEQEAGQEIEQTLKTLPASNSETESTGENNVKKTTTVPVPENYLTYEKYGLKFRYPSDWKIAVDSEATTKDIFALSLTTPKISDGLPGDLLIAFFVNNEFPLSKVVQIGQSQIAQKGFVISGTKPFELAGMPGSSYVATGSQYKVLSFVNGKLLVTFSGQTKIHSTYGDTAMIIVNSMEINSASTSTETVKLPTATQGQTNDCESISDPAKQYNCLKEEYLKTGNTAICSQSSDPDFRSGCFMAVAADKNSYSECNKVGGQENQVFCTLVVAAENGDSATCDKFNGQDNFGEMCHHYIQNPNENIMIDMAYLGRGIETKNLSDCYNIQYIYLRNFCVEGVKN